MTTLLQYDDDFELLRVWTDGSCLENNNKSGIRKAGYGVWFNKDHPWNTCGPVRGCEPTNNNAEIEAVIQAIKICAKRGCKYVEMNTDSDFVKVAVTESFPKWKKSGWKKSDGKPPVNIIKFQELDEAITRFRMKIKWVHVASHQKNEGNNGADLLAKEGAKKY